MKTARPRGWAVFCFPDRGRGWRPPLSSKETALCSPRPNGQGLHRSVSFSSPHENRFAGFSWGPCWSCQRKPSRGASLAASRQFTFRAAPGPKEKRFGGPTRHIRVELAEIRGSPQSARWGLAGSYWSALWVGGTFGVQAACVGLGAAFVGGHRKGFITSPARSASLRATWAIAAT